MYMDITTYSNLVERFKQPDITDPEHVKNKTGGCEQKYSVQPTQGF